MEEEEEEEEEEELGLMVGRLWTAYAVTHVDGGCVILRLLCNDCDNSNRRVWMVIKTIFVSVVVGTESMSRRILSQRPLSSVLIDEINGWPRIL